MPRESLSDRATFRPAPPGIHMFALGSAAIVLVQVLPNIGHSSVTARGSMLNAGLLMNPMKRGKLWLPVRNPSTPPSAWSQSNEVGASSGAVGLGTAVTSPAGFGRRSWATPGVPTSTRVKRLDDHFIGKLLQVGSLRSKSVDARLKGSVWQEKRLKESARLGECTHSTGFCAPYV